MKHSRPLFDFFTVLGITLLALTLTDIYLNSIDAVSIFASLPSELGLGFLFGGIGFLTVGVVGIGRQRCRNHRNLFTIISAVLVPLLTFVSMFFAITMIVVNAPMFPMRSEITQLAVVDTSPLVLSLNVKAITSRDTRIDSALVLNSYDRLVAECYNESIMVKGVETFQPLCVLPAGSEVSLTLNFNATLPSGDYLVRLGSWHDNHGSASFTIP